MVSSGLVPLTREPDADLTREREESGLFTAVTFGVDSHASRSRVLSLLSTMLFSSDHMGSDDVRALLVQLHKVIMKP